MPCRTTAADITLAIEKSAYYACGTNREHKEQYMALQVRRVVTGHDAEGRAVVKIDEQVKNVRSGRPNQEASVIWTSESFPVNNDGDEDRNETPGTTLSNGTVFRVVE